MDRMQPITITTSTATLTAEAHSGTAINLSRAAGIAVTLPAALGYGSVFEFIVTTTVTSNTTTIKVANGTDVYTGVAYIAADGGSTSLAFETAATDDTITLNGSTTGGILGDRIIIKDVAAGVWSVALSLIGTGTEATPFSATVS